MTSSAIKTPKIAVRQQFGVLPYRKTEKAGLEIMLVTSRETHRWIVPKGWPIKGLKPSASAAREAYEEAGLRGVTANRSIGSYVYDKRLVEKRMTVPCEVKVFRMRVSRQESKWPECAERETRWFSPASAIAAVAEAGLKAIIEDFTSVPRIDSTRPKSKRNAKKN